MGQIEKHSKIAVGLRKGIQKQRTVQNTDTEAKAVEQLDIFSE
jgi:DNA mismatch repair protein MutS